MIWAKILVLAFIGALIGWITNLLAIKLLFRPLEPIRIPLINFKIQGLIPKRRTDIARSIGETVEAELLSMEEIITEIVDKQNREDILALLKGKINQIVAQRLPSIIPSALKEMVTKYVGEIIDQEGERIIGEFTETVVHKATTTVKISEMIESRVNQFQLEELEQIVLNIARAELKHIEILGGVLGFVIGIFQGIIIVFL